MVVNTENIISFEWKQKNVKFIYKPFENSVRSVRSVGSVGSVWCVPNNIRNNDVIQVWEPTDLLGIASISAKNIGKVQCPRKMAKQANSDCMALCSPIGLMVLKFANL